MTVDTRATYQGGADHDGKKIEAIALKPEATVEGTGTGLGAFTLKNQEGKGSMLFDNDKGRLVETEVNQTVEMESAPPGQNDKIVWKVKLSLSAKLVPAK
jgi:hypothetical protein